jgi:hypothetical protein
MAAYHQIYDLVLDRKRRKNVLLFLTTEGGSADTGFRIARCLQGTYTLYGRRVRLLQECRYADLHRSPTSGCRRVASLSRVMLATAPKTKPLALRR